MPYELNPAHYDVIVLRWGVSVVVRCAKLSGSDTMHLDCDIPMPDVMRIFCVREGERDFDESKCGQTEGSYTGE